MLWWRRSERYGTGTAKRVSVASVDWRDGQQSQFGTLIKTEDMLPILSKMDDVGFESIEMWGGATFDVAIRYLEDDPWERLRLFKRYIKKTPLRMLLRGQNLVGYMQYADDIVEKFISCAAKNGIDKFLIFDGLNDVRNTFTAIEAVKKSGKKAEANICYTLSPVHTVEKYVQIAKEYEKLGVEAIHVEDMAGMLSPLQAYDIVRAIKKVISLPVHFHAHSTGGMADIAYWEAIRAGADVVDCCFSAFALGTAHPAVESLSVALRDTRYNSKLDLNLLSEINKYMLRLKNKYADSKGGYGIDISVLQHQIPGGMMSNLERQLKELGVYDRLPEILEEVHRVQKELGYPPLATPFAQMVGSQATFNIISGERYKMIPKEVRDYVNGAYGRSPGKIDPEIEKIVGIEKKLEDIRPGERIPPKWEEVKAECEEQGIGKNEEDYLIYALFPEVGKSFLEKKYEGQDETK